MHDQPELYKLEISMNWAQIPLLSQENIAGRSKASKNHKNVHNNHTHLIDMASNFQRAVNKQFPLIL